MKGEQGGRRFLRNNLVELVGVDQDDIFFRKRRSIAVDVECRISF